jgi:hypothetical protein
LLNPPDIEQQTTGSALLDIRVISAHTLRYNAHIAEPTGANQDQGNAIP